MGIARVAPTLAGVTFLLTAGSSSAQEVREQRVRFETASSSATVEGTITGYEIVDYVLGARGGQTMGVSFETDHLASYFNVLPPGSETALFVGSSGGDIWRGMLPVDGDYRIRVYLMRSAARRGGVSLRTLYTRLRADAAFAAQVADARWMGRKRRADELGKKLFEAAEKCADNPRFTTACIFALKNLAPEKWRY